MGAFQWFMGHWSDCLHAAEGVCTALIGIFLLVPGDQPEKTLQKIVDVIEGLSKK